MLLKFKIFFLLFIMVVNTKIFSWEKEEHQFIANLALDSTLSFCGINFNDSLIFFPGYITIKKKLWNDQTFGSVSALFSGNDISQSRCHLRGKTIMQQLEPLSAFIIDKVWNEVQDSPELIENVEDPDQSAVYNYLLYHLTGLRFAELAAREGNDKKELLRYALI